MKPISTRKQQVNIGNIDKANKAQANVRQEWEGTDVFLNILGAKLKLEQLQGAKWSMEPKEELIYFLILREKVLETLGPLKVWFLRPV